MLKRLKLKNFRQHVELEIFFTDGMNAIRGANEAGKTSLLLAIGYANWGTYALPLALEETVTWGSPVSSLRVELDFSHEGVDYSIYRGKSGCELTGGGKTVTGQREVTNFVSNLYKANLAVAGQVMIASQNSIRTSLEAGSSALIESLSGIDMIDTLIKKMQTHTECGSTKALDQQLVELEPRIAVAPSVEWEHYYLEIAVAQNAALAASEKVSRASGGVEAFSDAAGKALGQLGQHESQAKRSQLLQTRLTANRTALRALVVGEDPDISVLEVRSAQNRKAITLSEAHTRFRALASLPPQGTVVDFHATVEATELEIGDLSRKRDLVRSEISGLKSQLDLSGTCPTCKQDLKNHAEIENTKLTAQARTAELNAELAAIRVAQDSAQSHLKSIQDMDRKHQTLLANMKTFGEHVQIDDLVWPHTYSWVTDFVEPDSVDYEAELRKARTVMQENAGFRSKMQNLETLIEQDEDEISNLVLEAVDVDACRKAIDDYNVCRVDLLAAEAELKAAELVLYSKEDKLKHEQGRHEIALKLYTSYVEMADNLRARVAEMAGNNEIIKKLRDSRSVVASRLWGSVLRLISDTFSTIRGTSSVVTRGTDGFRIDGRPLGAFSGSTVDSLALAARVSLHKLFLGTVDFALFDEPASGMDANRETAMLGEIVRCGLPQPVVITHSALADTFANNLIEV